jgi:DNA-directed RNA polymerase specialized sigma24 family protein
MPRYLLSVHSVEGEVRDPMTDGELQQSWKQLHVLEQEMQAAGAWVFSGRLHEPDTATVVRSSGGEVVTSDGPFVESKEHLGGFYVIRPRTWTPRWPGHPRSPPPSRHRSRSARSRTSPMNPGPGMHPRPERKGDGDAAHKLDGAEVGRIFRQESGRSVAALIRIFGDLDLAEDAVQDAFTVALRKWPADGLPPNPGGWITTTARNHAIDRLRRQARGRKLLSEVAALSRGNHPGTPQEVGPVPDDRLRLIVTCCHPALSTEAQVALTLRLLGGLSTRPLTARVPASSMSCCCCKSAICCDGAGGRATGALGSCAPKLPKRAMVGA